MTAPVMKARDPGVGMNRSWLLAAAIGIGSLAFAHDRCDETVFANACDGPQHNTARQQVDRPEAASPPDAVRTREFPDGEAWTIEGGLAWGIGLSEAVVFVPHGFVHDKASVPPILWSAASYTHAAVVHDYLYWEQQCSRLQADNLLMIAMKEAGTPWLKRQWVYRGVRRQGESVWRKNAEERALGLPRLNPYGHVPDNLSWRKLRARMFQEGIRDVRYVVPDGYCRLGDSQEVPGPPINGSNKSDALPLASRGRTAAMDGQRP